MPASVVPVSFFILLLCHFCLFLLLSNPDRDLSISYSFSKKNLGENGVLKRQRNLTIGSAVKERKGAQGSLSHLWIMCLTFPNQWKSLGSPFLSKKLALMLAAGKLSEWESIGLPPSSQLFWVQRPATCSQHRRASSEEWRLGWPGRRGQKLTI